jgi:hypothetical protein
VFRHHLFEPYYTLVEKIYKPAPAQANSHP